MPNDTYEDILENRGFQCIGLLRYNISLHIWWQSEFCLEVICLHAGNITIVKGTKSYFMKSISDEGQTWSRDIPTLHEYLEAHFPEIHIGFSHFRDMTKTLAAREVQEHHCRGQNSDAPSPTSQLRELQKRMESKKREFMSTSTLLGLDNSSSDLLRSYLRSQTRDTKREITCIENQVQKEKAKLNANMVLQREYERKGSAASFVFSISSNVHSVESPIAFNDALVNITKELNDLHRYQITQKLCGSRLNIQIAESKTPVLTWQEQWLGGALSPRQLEKLNSIYHRYVVDAQSHLMVSPDEDILLDGHIKADKKLLSARIASTMLQHLDVPEPCGVDLANLPKEKLPIKIGLLSKGGKVSRTPCYVPLVGAHNVYVSGSTGSGKSYMARVLMEEATQYEDLAILILDPRNQASGLLVPEDRESILSLYPDFKMNRSHARSFPFQYYAPSTKNGQMLPTDLSELGIGHNIVSFKGFTDYQRCKLFRQILDAVFSRYANEESPSLRLMIFVEEAQNFTKRRVSDDAKNVGEQAEISLDRMIREGRKYGCCTVIISQSIRDFSHGSASIRQNTNTKIFLHNSDREIDYAADFIGNGRQIVQLRPGNAIFYNANWGSLEVKVRPPMSKVWEFSVEDVHKKLHISSAPSIAISPEAKRLLRAIEDHCAHADVGPNLTQASEYLGVTSKRQIQQIVDELERTGKVKTRTLPQRGKPRIIEKVSSKGTD